MNFKLNIRNFFSENKLYLITLTIFFIIILTFNFLTPFRYDDYSYYYSTNNFSTIIKDEFHQYMTWTGRSVVHVIVRFFTKFPKPVFNIFNSIIFIIFMVLVDSLSKTKEQKKYSAIRLLFIFALSWIFLPTFGKTIFWLTGSVNYLTAMVIMLFFIKKYHNSIIKKTKQSTNQVIQLIMFLLFGIIAGWCNENTSLGTLIVVVGYSIIHKATKKEKLPIWMITGIIGNLIGLAFMLAAPGNKIRAALFTRNNYSFLGKIIDALPHISLGITDHAFPLLFCSFLFIILLFWLKKDRLHKMISSLYLFSGIATIGVLATSPTAIDWSRSYFGGIVFILISLLISLNNLIILKNTSIKILQSVLYSFIVLKFLLLFVSGSVDILMVGIAYNERIDEINEQISQHKKDIIVSKAAYTPKTDYSIDFSQDITSDDSAKLNISSAKYFGVTSIKSVDK